ncbi:hypothetical protein [Humibacter sp. RRB41]|uniref:hypothetical protein n=1 Tax=Humibacter sp. RRB41 TaxID=2919946 RepID=UPI001FA944E1|nr:hypothetical protein [Humibacter sp. RRB41]
MWVDRTKDPADRPPPPSIDDWAALIPVPVLGLVQQSSVEEFGGGSNAQTSNGVTLERSVRISYTLWRFPEDKDDPRNLAELTDDMRRSLDTPPPVRLPEWIVKTRRLMRYPFLWDAVSTAWYSPDRYNGRPALEQELAQHANNILVNKHPEPGDRDADGVTRREAWERVRESHVQHGFEIEVNGRAVDGIRIDTDPYVYAVAADLGDRMLTAVFDRDVLPYLRLAFADRPIALPDQRERV